jgi:hypothetical protein
VGTGLIQYLALLLQPAAVVVRGIALREQPHLVVLVVVGHLLGHLLQTALVALEIRLQQARHKEIMVETALAQPHQMEVVAVVAQPQQAQTVQHKAARLVATEVTAALEPHLLLLVLQ